MESHSCLAGPNYRYRVISAQELELVQEMLGEVQEAAAAEAVALEGRKRQRLEQAQGKGKGKS